VSRRNLAGILKLESEHFVVLWRTLAVAVAGFCGCLCDWWYAVGLVCGCGWVLQLQAAGGLFSPSTPLINVEISYGKTS
jgi:hypothetical protein